MRATLSLYEATSRFSELQTARNGDLQVTRVHPQMAISPFVPTRRDFPRVSTCDVYERRKAWGMRKEKMKTSFGVPQASNRGILTPRRKPLCGLAQKKNSTFLNWTRPGTYSHFRMDTDYTLRRCLEALKVRAKYRSTESTPGLPVANDP